VGSLCLPVVLYWPPSLHPAYVTKLHCHLNFFSVKYSTNPLTLQMESWSFSQQGCWRTKLHGINTQSLTIIFFNTKWLWTWRLEIKC
jgi:hypothetical protein